MAVNSDARRLEIEAFRKIKLKLGEPKAFIKPGGFDPRFPDFGFRIPINQKKVDIHIEYKASPRAQMGSMRDWIFKNNKFTTNDRDDEDKETLVHIMNTSTDCIKNGNKMLSALKTYFDKRVTALYSGSLTIESNQALRRAKLLNFKQNIDNFTLANIENNLLGDKVIDHYTKKFRKNIRQDSDHSILLMMIGNDVWFVDEVGNLTRDEKQSVAERFGHTSIPVLRNLKANLEVRIQPVNLNTPSRAVKIDVMANFRLAGKPSQGATII